MSVRTSHVCLCVHRVYVCTYITCRSVHTYHPNVPDVLHHGLGDGSHVEACLLAQVQTLPLFIQVLNTCRQQETGQQGEGENKGGRNEASVLL